MIVEGRVRTGLAGGTKEKARGDALRSLAVLPLVISSWTIIKYAYEASASCRGKTESKSFSLSQSLCFTLSPSPCQASTPNLFLLRLSSWKSSPVVRMRHLSPRRLLFPSVYFPAPRQTPISSPLVPPVISSFACLPAFYDKMEVYVALCCVLVYSLTCLIICIYWWV